MVDFQRFGFHAQRTVLVLTLSGPVDPIQAAQTGNYDLRFGGTGGRAGMRIAVESATYNPTLHTITLIPQHRLPLRQSYHLEASGAAITYEKSFGDESVAGPSTGQLAARLPHKLTPGHSALQITYRVWGASTRHHFFRRILHGK